MRQRLQWNRHSCLFSFFHPCSTAQFSANPPFAAYVPHAPRVRSIYVSTRCPKKVLPRFRPARTNNTALPNAPSPAAGLALNPFQTPSTPPHPPRPNPPQNRNPSSPSPPPLE